MEFRERLKKLREERKLSQSGLARQIYVSRSAVAKRENGSGFPGKSGDNSAARPERAAPLPFSSRLIA